MNVLKERIALLHEFLDKENRPRSSVELGGLALMAISEREEDPELQAIAKNLGFSSLSEAQNSPVALMGTPDQVTAEIESRKQEIGISYYIVVLATPSTQDLFVREVMPKFC